MPDQTIQVQSGLLTKMRDMGDGTFAPVVSDSGLDSPAARAIAVSPNDGVDLTISARALYIGGPGNVSVVTVGGDTVTFVGLVAGQILPVRARRVRFTATTALNIVALGD
jgi:hypothetical protein